MSSLLLLVFLAPAAAVQCMGAPMSSAVPMQCCHNTSAVPAMDPNCCAMEQQAPARKEPATPVTLRSFDLSLSVALLPAAAFLALNPLTPMFADAVNTGPPRFDRLYLRLSAIRR